MIWHTSRSIEYEHDSKKVSILILKALSFGERLSLQGGELDKPGEGLFPENFPCGLVVQLSPLLSTNKYGLKNLKI